MTDGPLISCYHCLQNCWILKWTGDSANYQLECAACGSQAVITIVAHARDAAEATTPIR